MNKNLLFATIVSALGGFLFGFDTAVISGTTEFLRPYFGLSDSTLGFTVSIALIGYCYRIDCRRQAGGYFRPARDAFPVRIILLHFGNRLRNGS